LIFDIRPHRSNGFGHHLQFQVKSLDEAPALSVSPKEKVGASLLHPRPIGQRGI
jgi:hypothetical protein